MSASQRTPYSPVHSGHRYSKCSLLVILSEILPPNELQNVDSRARHSILDGPNYFRSVETQEAQFSSTQPDLRNFALYNTSASDCHQCGYRRSRPRIPIGSRPLIPI